MKRNIIHVGKCKPYYTQHVYTMQCVSMDIITCGVEEYYNLQSALTLNVGYKRWMYLQLDAALL